MTKTVICALLFVLVASVSVAKANIELSKANNDFSAKLYQNLPKTNGNLVFSPLSIHRVLTMLYFGAQGRTQETLSRALNLPKSPSSILNGTRFLSRLPVYLDGIQLSIAEKIYAQKGYNFNPEFNQVLQQNFNSDIEQVNFAQVAPTVDQINHWASSKVNGIGNVVTTDQISANTRLMLLNAIYFKGSWLTPFNVQETRTEQFFVNPSQTVEVQMMHGTQENVRYAYNSELGAKLIELPFRNTNVTMVIILPLENDGLVAVEKKLASPEALQTAFAGSYEAEVTIALPKFRITTKLDLETPLKNLGLGEIFDASKANFSNLLTENERLEVGSVFQKAVLEVNEEGATGKVVSGAGVQLLSAPITEYFLADHPFLVLIRVDPSSSEPLTLFQARVVLPESGDNWKAVRGVPIREEIHYFIPNGY